MDDTRRLRDILADQCEAKEIRLEELAKKTGLPEQYLDAIMSDVRTRLPALPYIRGYLLRAAELLGLPPELLLNKYRQEFSEKMSGPGDALPGNRFALPSGRRRYKIIGLTATTLLVLYAISSSGFLGRASITLDLPPIADDPIITSSSTIKLTGFVDPGDTLLINNQPVTVAGDGAFLREYGLLPEINIVEFSAKRFLGSELKISRQIYYAEPTATLPSASRRSAAPLKDLEPAEAPLP